ncbi:MAG: hypothetical protein EBU07_19135, partial [Betaproteobacteria bacterium]|nr:hypothetical protein [Betaproteobacteria bacterium]
CCCSTGRSGADRLAGWRDCLALLRFLHRRSRRQGAAVETAGILAGDQHRKFLTERTRFTIQQQRQNDHH